MKIVFPGPDGQPLSVEDTRRTPKTQKAIEIPADRRPQSGILGVFRA